MPATYYIEPADVDTYFLAYGAVPAEWTAASSSAKLQALQTSARWLDQTFGARWKGRRATQDQTLDWPRAGVTDRDGYQVSSTSTPTAVRQANAEAAVLHLQGELTTLGSTATGARILSESIRSPGGGISVTYAGGKAESTTETRRYPKVEALLRDVLSGGGGTVAWRAAL
jgi:hypothetical protein